jgi:hypothetical protein
VGLNGGSQDNALSVNEAGPVNELP